MQQVVIAQSSADPAEIATREVAESFVGRTVKVAGSMLEKSSRGLHGLEASPALNSEPTLPPLATIALNRMGYGPRPGDVEAFEALGPDDTSRLTAYVEQQLDPENIDDSDVEPRATAAGFTTLKKTFEQLWADHHIGPPQGPAPDANQRSLPFWEVERMAFIRALYSRRQLAEVMADFWHNHFNVFGYEYWQAPIWVSYDRDIIRKNSLGNFRVFLEEVATSFSMMIYLDGYNNQVAGPNENFARELFELHGLGAENYLGVRRQDEVPVDAERRPVGYVDDDVYESTRAFTGWGVDFTTGTFQYFPERHDRFQKYVLGRFLRADQAHLKDGKDVLDVVASHPGTARFISRKLCRRFISDDPPSRVVAEAAAVFEAQVDAPDQIAKVIRTILLSPEFRSTWGGKIKRPFEFAAGCCRAVGAEIPFNFRHQPSDFLISLVRLAGHGPFQWPSPDGYADTADRWIGSNACISRWNIANWLNDAKNWWEQTFLPFDPFAAMPATVRSPRAVADFWIQRILGRTISTTARDEIVGFMARGRDPETVFPDFSDASLRERVWGTIALIMTSPDNLLR